MDEGPVSSVARGALVLRQIASSRAPVSLSQLARTTALPKATVHRILTSLTDAGATIRTPYGYTLSREWSETLRPTNGPHYARLRRLLVPYVAELYRSTDLVCALAVRNGNEVTFLASVYGREYRARLARLPLRAPAHCTAAGQVLLAFDPQGAEALSGHTLVALTPHTITDVATLQRKLGTVRANGIAVSSGERITDMLSVSAPVTDGSGLPQCALSVGGPTDRVPVNSVATQLRRTAHAASRDLRSHSV